jgi:hypothetical protein
MLEVFAFLSNKDAILQNQRPRHPSRLEERSSDFEIFQQGMLSAKSRS